MAEVIVPANGTGDIGENFQFGQPWGLVMVRAHFVRTAGSGTNIAPMVMSLNAQRSRDESHTRFNHAIWVWRNVGVSASGENSDAFLFIPEAMRKAFRFGENDWLNFAWTNPDATEIDWGIEVTIDR